MKNYTIFAGVNGAGKTSIYKSIYYEENINEKRINTDMFKLVMVFDNGEMIWKDKKIPEWLNISFE